MSNLPPGYIDDSIQGDDRKLLEIFHGAELSEGGSADEVILRGIKAVLAHSSQQAPVAWCRSDDFNDAAKKRQSFSGWREKSPDCNMALYVYPINTKERLKPVPVSARPWEREGWCDADGKCWFGAPQIGSLRSMWVLGPPGELATYRTHSLPHWAIPLIKDDQP